MGPLKVGPFFTAAKAIDVIDPSRPEAHTGLIWQVAVIVQEFIIADPLMIVHEEQKTNTHLNNAEAGASFCALQTHCGAVRHDGPYITRCFGSSAPLSPSNSPSDSSISARIEI